MRVVLFEDAAVGQLSPVTLGRPALAIHCGGYRLLDLLSALGQPLAARVRPHLRRIVAADYPHLRQEPLATAESALWVNARLVPTPEAIDQLRSLAASGRFGRVMTGTSVAAAWLPAGEELDETP